jgi:hypothetical protein
MAIADDILKLIIKGSKSAKAATKGKKTLSSADKLKRALPANPADAAKAKPRLKPGEYVRDRKRTAFPGIYERPDEIARKAAERASPEDPALFDLFGVSRDDLYEMSKERRAGAESIVKFPEKARGSAAAENIMVDRNRQRIVDTLGEAEKYPELYRGMDAWYNMDPALTRLRQISNTPEEDFLRYNTFSGMASPGSDVLTETRRGTAARWLDEEGRFDDFLRYGGNVGGKGGPADMADIPGHPYHSTSQALPMKTYSETGLIDMQSPKVPAYIQSSQPNELGGTWEVPVGDAHFSRAVGLADTRGGQDFGASISKPELQTLLPWWQGISRDVGLQSVPAQARTWGVFSHATGVDTPVGAPKLELLARQIVETARKRGVDPRALRDAVLKGQAGAAMAGVGLLGLSPEDEEQLDTYIGGM